MVDPAESLNPGGMIQTGASKARIAADYQHVLQAAAAEVRAAAPAASLYVYGSVATGQAEAPTSDIDLLTVGLPAEAAALISTALSAQFVDFCRGVEISATQPTDLRGGPEAYGNRVFLRHYCVHLAGPDVAPTDDFAGDRRAARGFNGDIAQHARRWRLASACDDPAQLGRRIARKILLAVAALVSIHDDTWTTDRRRAAQRWSEIRPDIADDLTQLLAWTSSTSSAVEADITHMLTSAVPTVVGDFRDLIGLWPDAFDGGLEPLR